MRQARTGCEQCRAAGPGRASPVPRGRGSGLTSELRLEMEGRFGQDFSDVRVHANRGEAASIGARAFTRGADIHFAPGWWSPGSVAGRALLAHELTHVVQQRNGRFSNDAPDAARTRAGLEREAEAVERGYRSRSSPPAVAGRSTEPATLLSVGGLDAVAAALAGVAGGLQGMADWVVTNAGDVPMVAELQRLRQAWAGATQIAFPPEVAAQLEAGYRRLRTLAPSWVPVPDLRFGGQPALMAGPVVLALPVVLLLLAFLIVLWWVLTNLDPTIRRGREQSLRDFVDWLRRGVPLRGPMPPVIPIPDDDAPPAPAPTPPAPAPAPPAPAPAPPVAPPVPAPAPPVPVPVPAPPVPVPQPVPRTRVRPNPRALPRDIADPVPEDDVPRACIPSWGTRRGNHLCHDQLARRLSNGMDRELVLTPPRGPSVSFDAIDPRDPLTLIEVKTGHGRVFGDPLFAAETAARFVEQSQDQLLVATLCGFRLKWVFNNRHVRDWADGLLGVVPAEHVPFNCRGAAPDD